MKLRKTEEDLLELILVRFVLTSSIVQLITSAPWAIVVADRIIELKSFTILRSIRSSSVHLIQTRSKHVTMAICVLLLMLKRKLLLTCWISLKRILIFTCSISRQCGVLTLTLIIQEMLVYMLIIGKTLEESLMFSITKKSSVLNGKLRTLSKHMQMAVSMSIGASFLMDGKNKNTTH